MPQNREDGRVEWFERSWPLAVGAIALWYIKANEVPLLSLAQYTLVGLIVLAYRMQTLLENLDKKLHRLLTQQQTESQTVALRERVQELERELKNAAPR